MEYRESLDYLAGLTRFGINLGLERIKELMRRLGDPQNHLSIAHIGGTNGKGSTGAMLASILEQAGYRTGLFTSPHLHSYCERFLINGRQIRKERLAALITELRPHLSCMAADGYEHPTEFEVSTALAFLYFYQEQVDALVLEVGMGGAIDSTNVVSPKVTVITNVSLDHMEYLGNTVAEITKVKSGIIKPGVPLITAATGEALELLEAVCKENNAPLIKCYNNPATTMEPDCPNGSSAEDNPIINNHMEKYPPDEYNDSGFGDGDTAVESSKRLFCHGGRDVTWQRQSIESAGQYFTVHSGSSVYEDLWLPLLGEHQLANGAAALAAAEQLGKQGFTINS
ncbi:MAG: Mur ligase family protein, partial [Peptococcaceae bacterium]|nr:Mur ligase family protein [Peptococcaceae bacterium]